MFNADCETINAACINHCLLLVSNGIHRHTAFVKRHAHLHVFDTTLPEIELVKSIGAIYNSLVWFRYNHLLQYNIVVFSGLRLQSKMINITASVVFSLNMLHKYKSFTLS